METSLVVSGLKTLPAMQEAWVLIPVQETSSHVLPTKGSHAATKYLSCCDKIWHKEMISMTVCWDKEYIHNVMSETVVKQHTK